MSIKIYNAYKIKSMPIFEIMGILFTIKEKYLEKCIEEINKCLGPKEVFKRYKTLFEFQKELT